jgi:hypothetical protein
MKKIPHGLQSFQKIIEGGYLYVDKTKFVYNAIANGGAYFLSRPRRFGKSLLLSTFEALFSAPPILTTLLKGYSQVYGLAKQITILPKDTLWLISTFPAKATALKLSKKAL